MITYLLKVAIALSAVILTSESIKYFRAQPQFLDPDNWLERKPPCEADKILFPPNFDAVVRIPTGINVNGIILPTNGAIVFPRTSDYTLLDRPRNQTGCKNNDKFARVVKPKLMNWFDPQNWKDLLSTVILPAMPDVEKIPCSKEIVWFRETGSMNIDLEHVDNLVINSYLMGRTYQESTSQLERFLGTELGQIMFKSAESTKVKSASATCGCHGPNEAAEYEEKVCSHVVKSCQIPKCFNPIVPLGHCCSLCGALLKLRAGDCTKFNATEFQKITYSALQRKDLIGKVHSHSSFVQEGSTVYYQLIILDVKEYNEVSVNFMKEFKKEISSGPFGSIREDLTYSGRSYTPESGPSFWTLIISTFFAVVAFFVVIYAHFVRETPLIALPAWLSISRYSVFNSPFVRFENHPTGVDASENIVIAEGYASCPPAKETPSSGTTFFNNPMFSAQELRSEELGERAQEVGGDEGSVDTEGTYFTHAATGIDEELVEVDLGSETSAASSTK